MAKKASSSKTKAGAKTKAVKKATKKVSRKTKPAKKAAKKTATKKAVKKPAKKAAVKKPSKPAAPAKKTAKKAAPETSPLAAIKLAAKAKPTGPKKKVKTQLSKAELKTFREMLLNKRRSLIGDMGGIEAEALRRNRQEAAGDLSTMPTHPADIGTDNYELEFSLGLLESERTLLQEINEALDRIDDNTYGICLGTNQPISKARLTARPWAKYCIEYARMIEKGIVRPAEEESQDDYEPEIDDEEENDDFEEERYEEFED